ncbi:YbaN family protein [Herbaspirillum sp. WKF16]|uniref:YbaN family protein n=1 Tax=Herbaspirillum sp. WKF16 TaxID=3028312 RepID=UPI0023A9FADF|nr:YbaN family protein [Herbaspirillum sp. WKF16]WDZ95912.1 YbaN family protein [Herbaspirillum sp. WKF16]
MDTRVPGEPPKAEPPVRARLAPARTRWLWLALAYASLGMGIVAIFIPGIPTTEFILLSAWAAGRGSPRLQRWLEAHPMFGPMIHNWRNGRVVARRAKISASLMMSLCLVIMLFTVRHRWVIVLAALGMAAGAAWMWSRPDRVEDSKPGEGAEK